MTVSAGEPWNACASEVCPHVDAFSTIEAEVGCAVVEEVDCTCAVPKSVCTCTSEAFNSIHTCATIQARVGGTVINIGITQFPSESGGTSADKLLKDLTVGASGVILAWI